MKEALLDNRWMQDIVGNLMVAALAEFLHIWELIDQDGHTKWMVLSVAKLIGELAVVRTCATT